MHEMALQIIAKANNIFLFLILSIMQEAANSCYYGGLLVLAPLSDVMCCIFQAFMERLGVM
jgi:hypothetical protein